MELIRGVQNLKRRHRGCVLAIGNFDGVHRGHVALIERTRQRAMELDASPTIMMFEPMPREYFTPASAPARITEFRDKLRRFERAGIHRALCLRFDQRLAAMAAEDFVDELLLGKLDAKSIVIGDDFRFGAKRAGDAAMLRTHCSATGVSVDSIVAIAVREERCSSTALRDALAQADLVRVERLLGRPYSIIGRVRHGQRLGRELGMPTANLTFHHRPALRFGVYAVRVKAKSRPGVLPGVASIGIRPTVGASAPVLETHLFDNAENWYGQEIEVEPIAFIRPEERFESLDSLAEQMQRDAADARKILQ